MLLDSFSVIPRLFICLEPRIVTFRGHETQKHLIWRASQQQLTSNDVIEHYPTISVDRFNKEGLRNVFLGFFGVE